MRVLTISMLALISLNAPAQLIKGPVVVTGPTIVGPPSIGSTVATPTDSPGAGTYGSTQTVTLSDSTSGATICYRLDGSSPAATTPGTCSAGSTTYSGSFSISSTTTLKALGTKVGFTNSSILTSVYTIGGTVATPTDTPGAGSYVSAQSVILSDSTSGATICYTIDGSTPGASTAGTCNGTPTITYSGAFSVSVTSTIKAIGTKAGLTNSGVLTSLYTIGGGGTFTLNVVSTSNTQAILSYTAPSTSPCTVETSQSNTYLPLVNDVNTALFASSNRDDRDGDLGAGTTSRRIVVGQKKSAYALDSKKYSRALQNVTTHYARVTCGTDVGTASFTTANIPGGMTYQDVPSADSTTLGDYIQSWMVPTYQNNDRTATQIDQYTGTLLKAVTIYADRAGTGPEGFNMTSGAFQPVCTAGAQTSPVDGAGFVCQFLIQGPSITAFYFIRTSDGFARYLGRANPSDSPPVQLDPSLCFIGNRHAPDGYIMKYCYNGDWLEHADFPTDAGTVYTNVDTNTQMAAYTGAFDPALFGCGAFLWAYAGQYKPFDCGRGGGQDSYGWWGVYSGGDGRPFNASCTPAMNPNCPGIVAALAPMGNNRSRFCGAHNYIPLPNVPINPTVPIIRMNWHGMNDNAQRGTAQWTSTLTAGVSAGATSISVAGQPVSSFSSGDTFNPGPPQVNDVIIFMTSSETRVVTSVSGTGPYTLGMAALSNSHSSGESVRWECSALNISGFNSGWMLTYWKFLSDPTGTDTTNTYMIFDRYLDGGGHDGYGLGGIITEQGEIVTGDITTSLDSPQTLHWNDSPTFHGVGSYCFSSICPKHPSWHQTTLTPTGDERNNYTDQMTFNGGDEQFGTADATNVSGSLWKYSRPTDPTYSVNYALNKTVLFRKILPTIAITGGVPYLDISGPTSVIADTSVDNFKYCVAYIAGECISTSAAGDIYFNHAAALTFKKCTFADGAVPDRQDICIAPGPTYSNGVPQLLATASDTANMTRRSRILTHGARGIRQNVAFAFAKAVPDNSWYLLPTGFSCTTALSDLFCNIWAAKNPPFPAQDAYDRSDFIPINTGTITGGGSVNNAIVKFGYLEFGLSTDFYCGSRAEACFANSATIPAGANPYSYPTDGSSNTLVTLSGVTCTSTCNIDIPALSGHTLYYQVIKRDSGNAILSTGTTQVVIIP